MSQKQFFEGKLKGCEGYKCLDSCCNIKGEETEEWINEYFAFHEKFKDHLISCGIEIEFVGDRVKFKNCTNGRECKFLTHSLNKDIDPRPVDCKIYPYAIDWKSVDFDKKIVKIYYSDDNCPLVKNNTIPDEFRCQVESIVKRDMAALFYGSRFNVKFINEIFKDA